MHVLYNDQQAQASALETRRAKTVEDAKRHLTWADIIAPEGKTARVMHSSVKIRVVTIHYIGQRIFPRCPKNIHIRGIDGKELEDSKTNAARVCISMMPMIFIFGFTKKYLLDKKLQPIKDASVPSKSDVHADHRWKYKGIIKEKWDMCVSPLHNPLYFLL